MRQRKIIHVDMDAFYASVEQRDDPGLRGRPVVVGGSGLRSVVCAASYEARQFGIRSAMAGSQARRRCPDAVFVSPDFTRYRAVSRQVREIFLRHTDRIEPLSLDEAYLDVTDRADAHGGATEIARIVRRQIRDELQLTASAGVAPNKFLAKIASDWRKPDGLYVIRPAAVDRFVRALPVGRLPGVGAVTLGRLNALGVQTAADLGEIELPVLLREFGRYGLRLSQLARGEDASEVTSDRRSRSVSAEDTFAEDVLASALDTAIERLAQKAWSSSRSEGRAARTVVLKLKTSDFRTLTRSHTPPLPPVSGAEVIAIALTLRDRLPGLSEIRYRLVGVGLHNFEDPAAEGDRRQAELFAE